MMTGVPVFLKAPAIPCFPVFPISPVNPFLHLMNQIILSKKGQYVPMKQHSPLTLPHPQQILACAHEPGVLLNTFQLPTGCFTTLVCFKPGGFKAGTSLELPDAWWRFAKESSHSANIVDSKVVADIACGAEIVICRTPPEDRKSEEAPEVEEKGNGSDGFSCQRCGKVFSYEYYRDKHLKYTRCVDNGNRKFPCLSRNGIDYAFTFFMSTRTIVRMFAPCAKNPLCAHCGKAFASHAAHDSHVRRSHLPVAA
uniref:C2H2-type domain-containing protein n=1 Tax=Caenorhabditis tropicalis TaxID=1561998 RepID=A0A1I7URV8_9PELO